MEEITLSGDVIKQIKNFNHRKLTDEQNSLIDKLISNEELKKRYKNYGLCNKCNQPKTYYNWCQLCNAKRFQQNFKNWTSGNNEVDQFIQNAQLKASKYEQILEWIEYDRFENVEYLTKGGFGTIYKAIWKDGNIEEWDSENNQWNRINVNSSVVLKCLHNSQNITAEFLREIELHIKTDSIYVLQCFGITKDPESNNFMMVMDYAKNGSLRQRLNNYFNSMKWAEKLDILQRTANGLVAIHNKNLIHHDFHCEPKNAVDSKDDGDNSFEYSESIEPIDFTT
ncbi:kinase-like domain-containing protein [Rhizophagus irregularis DAOM 181602=DAOM 197198]|nr:kinase-like domain-containing protein [Rhizophagus irregularis DAOM 181602=DAOM 197198]